MLPSGGIERIAHALIVVAYGTEGTPADWRHESGVYPTNNGTARTRTDTDRSAYASDVVEGAVLSGPFPNRERQLCEALQYLDDVRRWAGRCTPGSAWVERA